MDRQRRLHSPLTLFKKKHGDKNWVSNTILCQKSLSGSMAYTIGVYSMISTCLDKQNILRVKL